MRMYRTAAGAVLTQKPGEPFFTDPRKGGQFYIDHDGRPVNDDGQSIEGEYVTKFVYTLDEYLASFPEAEKYRRFLTEKRAEVVLMQTHPNWAFLPGRVLVVNRYPRFDHPKDPKYSSPPTIVVNDGDDAFLRKTFKTEVEAIQGLEELKQLAPFVMSELRAFGYED